MILILQISSDPDGFAFATMQLSQKFLCYIEFGAALSP